MSPRGTVEGWGSAAPSPAVLRAGAVLRALAAANGRPLSIAALASEIGAPRSSTGNICAALVEVGMVAPTDGGFTLGRALTELGQAYLETFQPVRRFEQHYDRLRAHLEETAQLATLDGLDVLYLARRDGLRPIGIASHVGRRLPATCTAVGKAMLALLPDDELARRLDGVDPLPTLTPHSLRTAEELLADLTRIRERGYARDDEETTEGIYCIAVAVAGLPRTIGEYAVSVSLLKVPGAVARTPALVALLEELADGIAGHRRPARGG